MEIISAVPSKVVDPVALARRAAHTMAMIQTATDDVMRERTVFTIRMLLWLSLMQDIAMESANGEIVSALCMQRSGACMRAAAASMRDYNPREGVRQTIDAMYIGALALEFGSVWGQRVQLDLEVPSKVWSYLENERALHLQAQRSMLLSGDAAMAVTAPPGADGFFPKPERWYTHFDRHINSVVTDPDAVAKHIRHWDERDEFARDAQQMIRRLRDRITMARVLVLASFA